MDMIREIGKRMNTPIEFVNMGFDGLIPALITGNIDIIVEMALQTAAGRIRKDLGKAVEVAVEQTVRQTLGKL